MSAWRQDTGRAAAVSKHIYVTSKLIRNEQDAGVSPHVARKCRAGAASANGATRHASRAEGFGPTRLAFSSRARRVIRAATSSLKLALGASASGAFFGGRM